MELYSTKYGNNIRTVSGTPTIYRDDVVLECDTSAGPVVINLLTIPSGKWNTTWKLYIKDKSNNAATNNITINAGAGQTINNVASQIINVNNGSALVRIVDNSTYQATFNYMSAGGGGYNQVEDEGVPVIQRTVLNFVGAGVTVTDVGGKTEVNIPGGGGASIVFLTHAALVALITGNTLVPGQWYFVTDPDNADGILLKGAYSDKITSLDATGFYWNADYQGTGDYSGVPGFASWKGIWNQNFIFPVVAGDVVIYRNQHYKNLTGVNTPADPASDVVNWVLLAKAVNTGYIQAFDQVRYNIGSNRVVYRADARGNEVDNFTDGKGNNSLLRFQWGRDAVRGNKLRGQSIMTCTESSVRFLGNNLMNSSIDDNTPNQEPGEISFNTLQNNGRINVNNGYPLRATVQYNTVDSSEIFFQFITTLTSVVSRNIVEQNSQLYLGELGNCSILANKISQFSNLTFQSTQSDIKHCVVSKFSTFQFNVCPAGAGFEYCEVSANITVDINNPSVLYSKKSCIVGYSNWEADLDFAVNYAGNVLTIPPTLNYVGIFNCINTGGALVERIVQWPTNHEARLIPANGEQFDVRHTGIAAVVPDNMISDVPGGFINRLTGRTNGSDFVQYGNAGNLRIRTNIVVVG